MNPLSPLTYHRRHKGHVFLLTTLFALSVMGLYLFVGLAQETYIAPAFAINRYLDYFGLVQPNLVETLDPGVAERILANPDVLQVLPQNNVRVKVANVGGAYFNFRLFGLRQEDVLTVLDECGVTLKEGVLPQPGTNGVALSEEIAAALKLRIGDTFDRTKDEKLFRNIGTPLQVTGILSGGARLGILSYEYLAGEAGPANSVTQGLMVLAHPGRQAEVADFLRRNIRDSRTNTYTHQSITEQISRDQQLLYTLGFPIVLLVSIAIALVVGAIQQLVFLRRMPEFGTLHAFGYGRERLARRLAAEMAAPALAGFGLGIALGCGAMATLSAAVYAPRGFAFQPFIPVALLLTAPFPLVIVSYVFVTALRTIGHLDAVSIVERGELSLEGRRPTQASTHRKDSSSRPLSPMTYYRRHARQAAVLIGAMAIMIVAATLVVFVFAAGRDALQPMLTNFSQISAVSPNGRPLEEAVINQIRTHPATARVIPVYDFSPLRIAIPPMFPDRPIETLCVTAEDMTYLVDLYHLELAKGRLPQNNSNEIVFPWSVAKNRGIRVGDAIGSRDHPVYPDAPTLPVELVVSGIFAPAETYAEETWLSFLSLEFVDAYRESDLSLIVVPQAGQKETLDAWLESTIASETRFVYTYRNQQAAFQKEMNTMLLTFSLMVGIILLVAVLVLAGLHYIFVSQRTVEFGILNALGIHRRQLVGRIVGETLFTSGTAWVAAVVICLAVLCALQRFVFEPAGLRFEYLNLTPWLFTLPAPAALLLAGAATANWMLFRLDPIAIIEKRA